MLKGPRPGQTVPGAEDFVTEETQLHIDDSTGARFRALLQCKSCQDPHYLKRVSNWKVGMSHSLPEATYGCPSCNKTVVMVRNNIGLLDAGK